MAIETGIYGEVTIRHELAHGIYQLILAAGNQLRALIIGKEFAKQVLSQSALSMADDYDENHLGYPEQDGRMSIPMLELKDIVYKCLYDGSIYQDIHRNVVFCGKDKEGHVKYASLRGTYQAEGQKAFKGEVLNSDKRYGFRMDGTSDRLFVFEAPIDAMSHATLCKLSGLDWEKDNRLALGGTVDKALTQYLEDNPHIRQIVFCLDNDYCKWDKNLHMWNNIGQKAILKHSEKFKEGYIIGRSKPPLPYKDFNEYLTGTLHPKFKNECIQNARRIFEEHNSLEKFNELFNQQPAPEPELAPAL